MANYVAGVATRDTTPSDALLAAGRIWLWGYGARIEPCFTVDQPLSTRALVIRDSGGSTVVLVSIDIGALDPAMTARIKARIAQADGLSAEYICLNASHTHSAPVGASIPTWQLGVGKVDPDYGAFLEDQVTGVIEDALNVMQPANLAWARGQTQIGYYRHNGVDRKPLGVYDPTLDVLGVTDASGSVIAVVFSTACHPTGHDEAGGVSPDFPGVARELIEANFGGIGLFLQGYAGTCGSVGTDVDMGQRLATDAIGLMSGPMDQLSGPIDACLTEIDLPLQRLDTASLPGWASVAQANSTGPSDNYALIGRWAAYMQSLEGDIPTTLPTPLQAMRVGLPPDACYIVASGHEVAMEFAAQVRSFWPELRVTVIGYSNAQLSYVPSAQVLLNPDDRALFPNAEEMHNYEGGTAFLWYGHPGLLTTDVDAIFMQGQADLLNQNQQAAAWSADGASSPEQRRLGRRGGGPQRCPLHLMAAAGPTVASLRAHCGLRQSIP